MKNEYLFNFLLDNGIAFEKTFTNEYILIEQKIIYSENSTYDDYILSFIKQNYNFIVKENSIISKDEINSIFQIEVEYDYLII